MLFSPDLIFFKEFICLHNLSIVFLVKFTINFYIIERNFISHGGIFVIKRGKIFTVMNIDGRCFCEEISYIRAGNGAS